MPLKPNATGAFVSIEECEGMGLATLLAKSEETVIAVDGHFRALHVLGAQTASLVVSFLQPTTASRYFTSDLRTIGGLFREILCVVTRGGPCKVDIV